MMLQRRVVLAAAAVSVTAVAGAACALADPETDAAPEPTGPPTAGASCSEDLDGTLTALPGEPGGIRSLLECADGSWVTYTAEYPSSDRWLSTGPDLEVTGQGMRNAEFMAGQWIATPQSSDDVCRVEYIQANPQTRTGETHTLTGDPGQPLTFEAPTQLSTATLSGHCLWQREG